MIGKIIVSVISINVLMVALLAQIYGIVYFLAEKVWK